MSSHKTMSSPSSAGPINICILGAGFSGISSARRILKEARDNATSSSRPVHFYILEYNDRPGGKCLGIHNPEDNTYRSKSIWFFGLAAHRHFMSDVEKYTSSENNKQIRVEDVTEEFCHGTNGHWQFSDNNFQSVWHAKFDDVKFPAVSKLYNFTTRFQNVLVNFCHIDLKINLIIINPSFLTESNNIHG